MFRSCGTDETGAVPFARVGIEGELGNREDAASDLPDGEVHFPFHVLEDPQQGEFLGQIAGIVFVVLVLDSYQDQKSFVDTGEGFPVYVHTGIQGPLYD